MVDQFDLFGLPEGAQPAPARRSASGKGSHILPANVDAELNVLGAQLPANVALGTSSWSFPGWEGIVFVQGYNESALARDGLAAYACHPLFRAVGVDRTFYAPMTLDGYRKYVRQVQPVSPDFRFLVKAPMMFTAPRMPGDDGQWHDNPLFLNAAMAVDQFIAPATTGLGDHCAALVFQFPPLGPRHTRQPLSFADALAEFLLALPPLQGRCCYAVEVRDPELLVDDYLAALCAGHATHCLAIHARMPPVADQARFWRESGRHALVLRWSLHSGFKYEVAKARYAPFNRLVDEDPDSRDAIADLVHEAVDLGRGATVIVNNKAEGSSPLSIIKLAQKIVTTSVQKQRAT